MQIELLTIGDELLQGFTIDTNAAFLARTLAALGVEIVHRSTVGDEAGAIASAVREGLDRSGAVITTGGLGPTSDDLTRPAIAELFGRPLRQDPALVTMLEDRFRRLGYGTMPPSNLVQAMVPEGARVLENPFGSAPGLWIEDARGRWVAMLPGVPREMRGMTTDVLVPILRERVGGDALVIRAHTLRTTGIGESALAEHLGELGRTRTVNGLPLAYLPGWEGVDLRVTARGMGAADAELALERAVAQLRARAERYIYGDDDTDLATVVLAHARHLGWSLATAESCTGGMLGARITAIPGSSDVYVGGVVAYANDVKIRLLDVPEAMLREHGAVSESVARAMAAGVRKRFGAAVGMAITGVAGPGGGTPEKPVGTVWTAVDLEGEASALRRVYVGDREEIRRRSTQAALDMVRRAAMAR